MENDKLSNHIPNYPDQEDQNFNGKMNAKVEIQKNAQSDIQYENDGNNEANRRSIFRNHQKLQQIYLGPQTGNRYLLIWHDPGLGKTGTAIGIAESRHEWIDQIIISADLALKLNTHKALIIAQNKMSLNDNFSKDIMTKFTTGAYVTEQHTKHKYETDAAKKGSETTSIKHSYELQTHLAFAKKLSKMSNQEISKTYSFRVVIIDEVHILKTVTKIVEDEHGNTFEGTIGTGSRSKGTKFSHEQLMRLKENTYGCVIIILTGTPTVNIIQEFPSLINFITDKDNQVIPNGPGSFGEIIDRYGNDLNKLKLALQEYLVPKVTGRVSRMKLSEAQKKSIIRHNDGSALLKNTDKRLWLTRIDNNNLDEINYDYIQSAYKRALGLDEIGSSQQTIRVSDDSFYQSSLFANNMIWPGGLSGYRDNAFDIYLKKEYDVRHDKNGDVHQENVRFSFSQAFLEDFRQRVNDMRTNRINLFGKRLLDAQGRRQEIIQRLGLQNVDAISEDEKPEELEDIDNEIEAIEDQIAFLTQRRGQLGPNGIWTGTYNPNLDETIPNDEAHEEQIRQDRERVDSDITYMILTIKTFYSPMFGTVIEQIIGIETYDEDTKQYSYTANSATNNFYYEDDPQTHGNKDNRECAYIYNFYVEGGIVPGALFLGLFGYQPLLGSHFVDDTSRIKIPRGKRYAMLFGDSKMITSAKSSQILKLANHPENKHGHYLKAIYGTDVSALGVNLLNIRQAQLTYRKWNEAGNIQTEGRVDRLNSHLAFTDDEIESAPTFEYDLDDETGEYNKVKQIGVEDLRGKRTQRYVKIFRHANLYGQGIMSIAIKMYEYAAEKELRNSIITDILESVAYDGLVNLYPTDPRPERVLKYTQVLPNDYVTYNLFNAEKEIEDIKCKVRGFFKVHFSLKLSQLIKLLRLTSHSTTIIKALTEMVNSDERMIDRHGMLCYLREDKDVFFLQKMPRTIGPTVQPSSDVTGGTGGQIPLLVQPGAKQVKRIPTYNRSEQWMCYYSRHNFIKDKEDINDLNYRLNYSNIDNIIEDILKTLDPTPGTIMPLINRLSNQSKGLLVEQLVRQSTKNKIPKGILDIIFNGLKPWVTFWRNNDLIIHVYNLRTRQENQSGGRANFAKLPKDSRGELRIFVLSENVWRNTVEGEDVFYIPLINDSINKRSSNLLEKFSHIGISIVTDGKHVFKLNDKKQITRSSNTLVKGEGGVIRATEKDHKGRVAYTYKLPKLFDYLWSVDINVFVRAIVPSDGSNLFLFRLGSSNPNDIKITKDKLPDMVVLNSNGKLPPAENRRFDGVIHYKKIFPEIFQWIFLDEIARLNINELLNDKLFYPVVVNREYYIPAVLPAVTGIPYGNIVTDGILKILPDESRKIIYGDSENPTYESLIRRSLEGLLRNIMDETLTPDETIKGVYSADYLDPRNEIPDDFNPGDFINYGVRFRTAWPNNKEQLCILIFLTFFLQGSIQ